MFKPGGHVALLDVAHTKAYLQVLIDSGMADVRRSRPRCFFRADPRCHRAETVPKPQW